MARWREQAHGRARSCTQTLPSLQDARCPRRPWQHPTRHSGRVALPSHQWQSADRGDVDRSPIVRQLRRPCALARDGCHSTPGHGSGCCTRNILSTHAALLTAARPRHGRQALEATRASTQQARAAQPQLIGRRRHGCRSRFWRRRWRRRSGARASKGAFFDAAELQDHRPAHQAAGAQHRRLQVGEQGGAEWQLVRPSGTQASGACGRQRRPQRVGAIQHDGVTALRRRLWLVVHAGFDLAEPTSCTTLGGR